MPDTTDQVVSDLHSPLIGVAYLALLPLWLLLFVKQVNSADAASPWTALYAAGVLFSIAQFWRGLGLLRQRVRADARGVRMEGLGGFDLSWSQLASLKGQSRPRAGYVVMTLRDGQKVTSDYLIGRARTRRFEVKPDALEPLLVLAARQGVTVER